MRYGFVIVMAIVSSALGFAQEAAEQVTLETAVLQTKTDIDAANVELQTLRDAITAERLPLAEQLDSLQKEVKALRKDVERAREVRQQGEREYAVLVDQTDALDEEYRFLATLFSEYRRSLETRASEAEQSLLAEALPGIDKRLTADAEESLGSFPQAVEALLTLAEDWNTQRLGGARFAGNALDEDGIEHTGQFATFGPLAYFSATDNPAIHSGLAVTGFGSTLPSLYANLPETVMPQFSTLVQGSEVEVPLDLTEGDALKIREARQGLVEHVKKGGFVMIPLLALGGLGALLALWKFIDLSLIRIRAGAKVMTVIEHVKNGRIDEARTLAKSLRGPLATLVKDGIELHDAPREHLEEIMHEHVLSYVPRLERHLGTLAVFGGVAPLLGLLGTVTGMIHTFQLVTIFGSGDAKLLSGGISEALVTTEFGLAIAIPVLLVHAFLSRRSRTIIGVLEQTATGLVNELTVRVKPS